MDKSIKRRWGDRRDGRWVRDVPGLTTIMMHIKMTVIIRTIFFMLQIPPSQILYI